MTSSGIARGPGGSRWLDDEQVATSHGRLSAEGFLNLAILDHAEGDADLGLLRPEEVGTSFGRFRAC